MPHEIKIPSVGESITSATLASWLKPDGAFVEAGEIILSFDTDKISQELEADRSGILRHAAAEGDELEIGAVVARIEEGEAPAGSDEGADEATPGESGEGGGEDSPPPAESETKPEDAASGDPETADEAVKATPVARKIAADEGIDLSRVSGSGAGGKVTKADVLGHAGEGSKAAAPADAAAGAPPGAGTSPAPRTTRRRMSPLRKKIATHLVNAQQEAAILTTFNECDMSRILAMRKSLQEGFTARHGVKLGFMSFFIKAVVDALQTVPALNARLEGDEIVEQHYYDIGVAVGTDKGLMVPVLRDCDTKSFAGIEQDIVGFAKKAREGGITLADLQGGVFTITNGGIYGSLLSTPILNPPQSGILGMHSIQERPVAVDGAVVIRPMMYLALSYDHRLVDGKEAVTFLVRVKDCLENPERLLVGA